MSDCNVIDHIYFLLHKKITCSEKLKLRGYSIEPKPLSLNTVFIYLKRAFHQLLNKLHVSPVAGAEWKLQQFLPAASCHKCNDFCTPAPQKLHHVHCRKMLQGYCFLRNLQAHQFSLQFWNVCLWNVMIWHAMTDY